MHPALPFPNRLHICAPACARRKKRAAAADDDAIRGLRSLATFNMQSEVLRAGTELLDLVYI